tara:strand:+ start:715 stop:1071 length:357 start_codon:yes stop_codon:yes gene_type:complete
MEGTENVCGMVYLLKSQDDPDFYGDLLASRFLGDPVETDFGDMYTSQDGRLTVRYRDQNGPKLDVVVGVTGIRDFDEASSVAEEVAKSHIGVLLDYSGLHNSAGKPVSGSTYFGPNVY